VDGAGLTDALHHAGDGVVHRLAAETKLVAAGAFVLAVVLTPREAAWAFAIDAVVVAAVVVAARLPWRWVLGRMRIEVPFLAFAVFLPIVGASPRVEVIGVSLSEPGLWAAWNVVAKGTLAVAAAVVLAGTTPVAELLGGLDRLRLPRAITSIAGFMVRYLDVIAGEAARMRIARLSRGHDPRWLWQSRAIASTAGTLFVRSYERGERVHLAMLSRGYSGAMPPLHHHGATGRGWLVAALPATVAALAMVGAQVAT
jgi:cobalt/nickel transport system permease protein